MKNFRLVLILIITIIVLPAKSQDTFSIVAIDPETGDVGSAGASCVDLLPYPTYRDGFLGELFPGVGAINTQAYYLASNQINARNRMNLGDTPIEIIAWLEANDVQNHPEIRQYGVVAFVDGDPQSAAYTGVETDDEKGHICGPNYSIQGNILLGHKVLDSIEAYFLRAEGDLACKLMAALQGANMVGADSRCATNGTSSLFAFVKVAEPEDIFGEPKYMYEVITADNAGIEPIDSLQIVFDLQHNCNPVHLIENDSFDSGFDLSPNPSSSMLNISTHLMGTFQLSVQNMMGQELLTEDFSSEMNLDISSFDSGIYFIRLSNEQESYLRKFIKQ